MSTKKSLFTRLRNLTPIPLYSCAFGFAPYAYMKMIFPLVILAFLPVRHMLIPKIIEEKYLLALDGHM